MAMEMRIRPFEAGDRAMVEAFYGQMGYESRFFFNATGYNYARSMRFFGDDPDADALHMLAVAQGRMVGYVFLWHIHKGVVEMGIAVADDAKGQRLGEKLIDEAKAWCRAHRKGGILLTTHPANIRAQSLYRRCGFEFLGVSDNKGEFLYLYNMPVQA